MASKVSSFPPGSKLFAVSHRQRVNEKKVFFTDPARAMLWAVMTEDALRPIPLTREENIAQVMAQSLHEKLVRKARFPLNSEYVLAMVSNAQEVRFIDSFVTDEQFAEVEKLNRTAVGLYRQSAPSFVKASFISVLPNGQVNIDQTYENLANLTQAQLTPLDSAVIRVTGPSPFIHVLSYSIDWEQTWQLLIELLARHGSENMGAIKNEVSAILANPNELPRIITGEAPPGYDDCYDALIGPFNQQGNSCFMDSTLVCMFAFKNSPYYQKLIVENARTDTKFTVCSNDRARDRALRLQIQDLLREDVSILMSGRKRFHCTNLRRVLGGLCAKEGTLQDMSQGTHDPAELYARLVDAIGYSPITVRTVVYRARDEDGTDEVLLNESVTETEMLPSLRASDDSMFAAAWPYSWQSEYENMLSTSDRNRPFIKTVRQILRADAIVVHIDRSVAAGEQLPVERPFAPAINPLLTLFGSDEGVYIPPEFESFEAFEQPSNPAKRNEARVNARPIAVETEMNVNGVLYVLKGVVYSPNDGHYASLLHCGNHWFNFNDLQADQPISRAPVSEEQAALLMNTRGSLFFYYPVPAGRVAPLSDTTGIQTPLQSLTLGGKK